MPYVDSLLIRGYDSCLQSGENEHRFEYAEYDLNSDGIPELMLHAPESSPSVFGWSMLFSNHNCNAQLVYYTYGYGYFTYSPQFEELTVPTETKPSYIASYSEFYLINGMDPDYLFIVGSSMGECFYNDGSESRTISEEELESYTADLMHFDWIALG